jgi:hypothetical protein
MKSQLQLRVQFPKCGAEFHPAFLAAELQPTGAYEIKFPRHIKGILKSYNAQVAWAEEKIKHLKSWGVVAVIIP